MESRDRVMVELACLLDRYEARIRALEEENRRLREQLGSRPPGTPAHVPYSASPIATCITQSPSKSPRDVQPCRVVGIVRFANVNEQAFTTIIGELQRCFAALSNVTIFFCDAVQLATVQDESWCAAVAVAAQPRADRGWREGEAPKASALLRVVAPLSDKCSSNRTFLTILDESETNPRNFDGFQVGNVLSLQWVALDSVFASNRLGSVATAWRSTISGALPTQEKNPAPPNLIATQTSKNSEGVTSTATGLFGSFFSGGRVPDHKKSTRN